MWKRQLIKHLTNPYTPHTTYTLIQNTHPYYTKDPIFKGCLHKKSNEEGFDSNFSFPLPLLAPSSSLSSPLFFSQIFQCTQPTFGLSHPAAVPTLRYAFHLNQKPLLLATFCAPAPRTSPSARTIRDSPLLSSSFAHTQRMDSPLYRTARRSLSLTMNAPYSLFLEASEELLKVCDPTLHSLL